jgi:hypothetical protein
LYDQIVGVCRAFLGAETDSFLSRQCVFHLHKAPRNIERDDIPEIARWVEISGALVIGKERAKEMRKQIEALGFRRASYD